MIWENINLDKYSIFRSFNNELLVENLLFNMINIDIFNIDIYHIVHMLKF